MTDVAIVLVLSSAFTHALWNFVAKRAIGGMSFIWLFGALEVILYFPIIVFVLTQNQTAIGLIEFIMIGGSALLHLAYFLSLTYGYRVADLSVVYPLSRGIGPLLSTIFAVILLSERPSTIAVMGTVLITLGIIGLTGDPRKLSGTQLRTGILFGGLTGMAIAAYTIWDSYAVSEVNLSPIIFQWGVTFIRLVILTPIALRYRSDIHLAWQHDKWKAMTVAVFSSLSYVLMLFALSFSQVSYVAPLRSISILMGVLMGTILLKEGNVQKRFKASAFMVIGAIALGLG